jgi:hypothetical protein
MMKIRNVSSSRWWQWHPPVGVFIAILAVVGVVVPWFKGEHASRTERAMWSVGMFLCMGFEIRSIYLAQAQHDKEQEMARSEQLKSFTRIADGINTAIANSRDQFDTTMEGLRTNLVTATDTFNQTRPKADVLFEVCVYDPLRPLSIRPNAPVGINFRYRNFGNEAAINVRKLGMLYVASTDESEAAAVILPLFDATWEEKKRRQTPGKHLAPGDGASDGLATSGFSVTEVSDIMSHKSTLYWLFRVEYSDNTGRWISEHGDVLQEIVPSHNQLITIHCNFFNTHRRPSE